MRILSLLIFLLSFYVLKAQDCPDNVNLKTNASKCIEVFWNSGPPANYTSIVYTISGSDYPYLSGGGTSSNPAIYITATNCNGGTYAPYTGTMTTNTGSTCIYTGGVLPVTIGNFYLEKDDGVIIHWTTTSEINNDYFEIERSKDGRQFSAIGQVQGIGQSKDEQSYSFWDPQPFPGISYYRIVQYDLDGTSAIGEVLTFRNFNGEDQVFYHQGTEMIEIFNAQENTSYAISSINGSVISGGPLSTDQNNIDVAQLTPGLYFVTLIGQEAKSFKVFVTR
jgi:hypothetical protein